MHAQWQGGGGGGGRTCYKSQEVIEQIAAAGIHNKSISSAQYVPMTSSYLYTAMSVCSDMYHVAGHALGCRYTRLNSLHGYMKVALTTDGETHSCMALQTHMQCVHAISSYTEENYPPPHDIPTKCNFFPL